MKYCCGEFKKFIDMGVIRQVENFAKRGDVEYYTIFEEPRDNKNRILKNITHCPFCGKELGSKK